MQNFRRLGAINRSSGLSGEMRRKGGGKHAKLLPNNIWWYPNKLKRTMSLDDACRTPRSQEYGTVSLPPRYNNLSGPCACAQNHNRPHTSQIYKSDGLHTICTELENLIQYVPHNVCPKTPTRTKLLSRMNNTKSTLIWNEINSYPPF